MVLLPQDVWGDFQVHGYSSTSRKDPVMVHTRNTCPQNMQSKMKFPSLTAQVPEAALSQQWLVQVRDTPGWGMLSRSRPGHLNTPWPMIKVPPVSLSLDEALNQEPQGPTLEFLLLSPRILRPSWLSPYPVSF